MKCAPGPPVISEGTGPLTTNEAELATLCGRLTVVYRVAVVLNGVIAWLQHLIWKAGQWNRLWQAH